MVDKSRIISGLVTLALLGVVPVGHAQAASVTVNASVQVNKPLTFTAKQNLNFGTVTVSSTPGTYTVSLSMAGALTCPTGLTCTGVALPAIFNVSGSNGQTVRIFAAPTDLVNAADGSKIRFTPVAPASVTLTNSGFPGKDFNVGGSIAIPSTADGSYTGTVEVTADYQ